MSKGDHIIQKSYIKHVMGNKGFWIIYNERGKYNWKFCKSYTHKMLMYRGQIKNLNPEKRGHGTSKLLTLIENTVSDVSLLGDPVLDNFILNIYNEALDYGLQMKCRYEGMKKIKNSLLFNYDDIFSNLQKKCTFRIPKELLDIVDKYTKENKKRIKFHFEDVRIERVELSNNDLIISENPVLYSNDFMVYPLKSNILYSVIRINDVGEKLRNDLLLTSTWVNKIIDQSELFLIAHENFPEHNRNIIEEHYNKGRASLIEII